jgi:hypothetical protein
MNTDLIFSNVFFLLVDSLEFSQEWLRDFGTALSTTDQGKLVEHVSKQLVSLLEQLRRKFSLVLIRNVLCGVPRLLEKLKNKGTKLNWVDLYQNNEHISQRVQT